MTPPSVGRGEPDTETGSETTSAATPPNDDSGFRRIASVSARLSPTSLPSAEPSRPSTPQYRKPKNVREFASQANRVATAILNREIDLDTARAYSAVARTVAQAVSSEVVRARFLRTAPDLEFFSEDEDEG